jgi:mannose-1-phosphate guanylyltransferase
MQSKIIPVILCGGSGTRLLPFLKYNSPKQFLNILDRKNNLLQNTLIRFVDQQSFDKPIIVGNISHKSALIDSIREIRTPIEALILEEDGKNTGPAIAAVMTYLKESGLSDNKLFLIVPIDHYIGSNKQFLNRIKVVGQIMQNDAYNNKILTFSVHKTTKENNYGHLKIGMNLPFKKMNDLFEVVDFIEKPEHDVCLKNTLWNSGIYCMSIKACQNIIMKNSPYTWHYSYQATTEGMQRTTKTLLNNEIILNHKHFSKNSSISFDQIITMPYERCSIICTDIGTEWEDVGLWSGITRLYVKNNTKTLPIINQDLFVQQIQLP